MRPADASRFRQFVAIGFIGAAALAPLAWAWTTTTSPRQWLPHQTTVTVTRTTWAGAWWQPALEIYGVILPITLIVIVIALAIAAPIAPRRF